MANTKKSAAPPSKKTSKKSAAPKRAPKTKSVAAPPTPAPPVVETASVPEAVVEEKTSATLMASEFTAYLAKLQQAVSLLSTLRQEFRVLERKTLKELKTADKVTAKRKKRAGVRAPSGFVKPTKISDELASFLEKPSGTEMARTEVTREINAYIRAHNLQDKVNGRKINADQKLSTLLSLTDSDELTYFNLQKYMSRHFHKATKSDASSSA
tara:strand:+ start:441 stop:1076 length:636 start_codon:yes stop_codon:yes gene_type:complete